ncbi:hypothetical protein [Streptomyces sp. NPDC059788]|uniref:hypothetical protein n=1 Tax=Streptomyces sp. NPDC059788 TaxID=3346948 RepID=UPI0036672485
MQEAAPPGGTAAGELADALRELIAWYPVDPPWSEPAVTLTLAGPEGERYALDLRPGAAAVLSQLVRTQTMTCEGETVDGSARCMHCDGRGRQHPATA